MAAEFKKGRYMDLKTEKRQDVLCVNGWVCENEKGLLCIMVKVWNLDK